MPMQMKSRVVNMRMPNVVWLMSFLRGEVDACDPDYNTNHKGESGKQPASAEEDTYEGGSDSSRTDFAEVICYSRAFFGCHGGPLIARPSPCQVGCLARGEVGEGLDGCDWSYEIVTQLWSFALGRLALTGATLDRYRFGVVVEPLVQINAEACDGGDAAELIPVISGGRYAREMNNRLGLGWNSWSCSF